MLQRFFPFAHRGHRLSLLTAGLFGLAVLFLLPSAGAVSRLISAFATFQSAPTVTQFYPVASTPGATILVQGTGFDPQNTQVFFGGASLVPATVTVVDSTLLRVTVPAGSTNPNGYLTVRVNGVDTTTQSLPTIGGNPNSPNLVYRDFVVAGDVSGNGLVQSNDVTLMQGFVQGQTTPTTRQVLAGNVVPLNANGSRGDGSPLATADTVLIGAVVNGQATFCPCGESGVIRFSTATTSVAENAGSVTLTVNRVGGSDGSMTVSYTTVNGTATAPADYTTTSDSVTFANGDSTPKTFTIPIVNNIQQEPNETFSVTLATSVGNAPLGTPAIAVVTITDDDAPAAGQLQFSGSTLGVTEGGGNASLTVTRTGGSGGTVTVQYATANGTAAAGSDYTTTSGTVTFAAGETSKTITVPILEDSLVESAEAFTVTLSNPTGGATLGSPVSSTVTITDNDVAAGQLQFSAASFEVAENGGNATLTVTRTGGSSGTVTVQYATADDSATAGADYTLTSATLTFANGETSQTIAIPILNDGTAEPTETFTVSLSNPTGGATLGTPTSASVTITDNDAVATASIQLSDDHYRTREGETTNGQMHITVVRTGSVTGTSSVRYSMTPITASAGTDFVSDLGTLTFAPGETTKTLAITINNDAATEPSETFRVNLSNPNGAVLGTRTWAEVTILNSSTAPFSGRYQWSAGSYTASEAVSSIPVAITRTDGASGPLTVVYATQSGTATAGSDFTSQNGSISWSPGDTVPKFITIDLTTDGISEGNETFTLTLTGPDLGNPSTATVTILDDGANVLPGSFKLNSSTYQTGEGGPSIVVTVERTEGTMGGVGVSYNTSNGTATAGQDYKPASGTLAFGFGETSKTITVQMEPDDTTYEGDETFTLALSNPTGGAALGTPNSAMMTIVENDSPPLPELRFTAANYQTIEGNQVALTVERIGTPSTTVSVSYSTMDGTALNGTDYTTQTNTLTFAAGVTSQTILIDTIQNSIFEDDEKFRVNLSNPTNATLGTPNSGLVTIVDNDILPEPQLQFAASPYSCRESETGRVVVTVVRTGNPNTTATVDYTTVNGSALSGQDYQAVSGTLTFEPGESARMIAVPVYYDDNLTEGTEYFEVMLSNPIGATLLDPKVQVTVYNHTGPVREGTVGFSSATYIANELDGGVLVTVTRTNGAKGPLSKLYSTVNRSATAGSDFTAVSGTLTWSDGDSSNKTILIPITPDGAVEGNETFAVSLTGIGQATVVIADNAASSQAGSLQLGQANFTFSEQDADVTVMVPVVRVGGKVGAVGVHFSTSNGTATASTDYTQAAGTVTFADGETTKNISLTLKGDIDYEGDEDFFVTLDTPTGGARLGAQVSSAVTIQENDPEPAGEFRFSAAAAAVNETAGQVTLTVQRVNGKGGAVSVAYATANLTATGGSSGDFEPATGTLSFADQEASKDLTITLHNDLLTEGSETFKVVLSNPTNHATIGNPSEITVTIGDDETAGASPTLTQTPQGITISAGQTATLTVAAAGTAPLYYQWYRGSLAGSGTLLLGATGLSFTTPSLTTTTGYWVRVSNGYGVVDSIPAFVNVGNCNVIALSPSSFLPTTVGTNYSQTLSASGGSQPYAFDVTYGALPVGMSLSPGGALAGIPTTSGTVTFVIRATDSGGCTGTRQYSLTVNPVGCTAPTINPATVPNGTVGTPYNTSLTGSGGTSPYSFSLEAGANFPPGLILTSTGLMNGTPTTAGSYTFNVQITDSGNCVGTKTYSMTIYPVGGGGAGQFKFSQATYNFAEGAGTITLTILRENGSSGPASVVCSVSGGLATNGKDFNLNPAGSSVTVNFADGQTSQTVDLTLANDLLVECDEDIRLTLSSPTGATLAPTQTTTTVTIADNDTLDTLALWISTSRSLLASNPAVLPKQLF